MQIAAEWRGGEFQRLLLLLLQREIAAGHGRLRGKVEGEPNGSGWEEGKNIKMHKLPVR